VNPAELAAWAARGRTLVNESREAVLVLDGQRRLVAASRRAREAIPELAEGRTVPEEALRMGGHAPVFVDYEVEGRRETLAYLGPPAEVAAYEELRTGFTAAVSHELRTPLARMLALLETLELPDVDRPALVEQARQEIEQARELIDDVLFLGELETGREVVGLGTTRALPIMQEVIEGLGERAAHAGVELRVSGSPEAELPLRPRMLRVVAENLTENALRYAGPGTTFRLSVVQTPESVVLLASDDGGGVGAADLPRLFERFYRADRARASRGTGLGLAIVKHIVTSAGGTVDARGGRGRGLEIRSVFPRTSR
jgi:two-component system phosphate regulon sensor histidine kinase PhoR